jgi:hypothetical protein
MRFTGGFVRDVNQLMMKGYGIFSYPSTQHQFAKLRIIFELVPVAVKSLMLLAKSLQLLEMFGVPLTLTHTMLMENTPRVKFQEESMHPRVSCPLPVLQET